MQHPAFEEVTFHPKHEDERTFKQKVIKTTIILSIITVIELGFGLLMHFLHMPDDFKRLMIKGIVVILSLAKAFYIVAVFMHLGDEIRNMIMTIVVPLMLFIWFIIGFIADGNSYKNLRNKYDKHFKESTNPHKYEQKANTHQIKPGGKN